MGFGVYGTTPCLHSNCPPPSVKRQFSLKGISFPSIPFAYNYRSDAKMKGRQGTTAQTPGRI